MPFTAPSEELTQSSQGFTAPDDDIQQPTPRFQIQPTPPDSSTAPIPRGLTKTQLQQRQQDARVDAIPAQLAESALNVAEPLTEQTAKIQSNLLNLPNTAVGLVAPNSSAAQPAFKANTPVINVPSPTGTGVAAGLGRLGAGLLSGLTTPESIVTLPAAAQSAIMRALFAGQMVKDLPQETQDAYKTLQDPNATTADKIVAVGNPVIQSAMVGALSFLHPKAPASGLKSADIPVEPKLPNENQPNNIAPPETPPVVDTPPPAPDAASPVAETPSPADNAGNTATDTAAPAEKPVLEPGLRVGDTVYTGQKSHQQIFQKIYPELGADALDAFGDDASHVFVDQNGKVYNREDAAKAIGRTGALMSEDLPKQTPAPSGENVGQQIGAKFDGNIDFGNGKPAKQFTFNGDKSDPHYGATFQVPADVTLEQIKSKAKQVQDSFSTTAKYTLENNGGKFNILSPSGRVEETFDNAEDANKALADYNPENLAPPPSPQAEGPTASLQPAKSVLQDSGSDVPLPEGTPTPAQPIAKGVPTGLKFETLDKERAARGLEPLTRRLPVADQETMNRAMETVDKNPDHAANLVKELNIKPRTISDVDRATLLLRRIDLRKQYDDAFDDLVKAHSENDDAGLAQARVRVADASDKLQDLEEASGKSGSEQGAGLRALRLMANEDYSLAGLEQRARASKGGQPLTDTERAELVKTADDYKKANDELQKHLDEKSARISELEVKSALDKIALEAKTSKVNLGASVYGRKGILQSLEARANSARERIKNRPAQLNTGLDPTQLLASLRDEIEIGAYHVARIGTDVAKWTKKQLDDWTASVKKELGDKITPNLPLILEQAKNIVADASKLPTHEEQIAAQSAKIKEKFVSGKKDEVASQVQKLARLFVERGITGRDALVDAVHNVLKESDPEITRRETMDAISGYGDFKQLSKDEISVKLRGLKGEMQQVAKLEDMADGIPPSKTGVERRSPTDAERKLIKAVNEAKIKFQVPITDPVRQIKSALDTKKIQLENQIKDLNEKIANNDFAKQKRRPLELDRRAQELTAQKERVAKKFKQKQKEFENEALSKTPKAANFISNIRRFAVLSGAQVIGKLAAYSATKIPTIGVTEAIGNILSKLPKISQIAKSAPSEGSSSLANVARATAKGLTKGFEDAYKTAKTGQSDLKAAFSDRPEVARSWLNFFQTVHEVIKSPLRRAAFELSLAKRMESAARNGADINDPMTQLALSKDAYLDSDRALLLENNRLANGIRVLLKNLETPDKKTGRIPIGGKTLSTIGRVELPILTVPLNYVKQTLDAAFGLAIGSGKAALAFRRGIDNLDPKEADEILRHLKYGTIGGAALLYGFYDGYKNAGNQQNATLGGFYQPGEKRKDNQAGINGIRVGGHNVAGLFLHNPVLAVAQLGHTMGAILGSKINKKSDQKHSVPVAVASSLMGLLNESPYGTTTDFTTKLADSRSAEYALGEHVKGLVVPTGVQELAKVSDLDAKNNVIKRDPKTALQHIETGIPFLRQTVKKK